MLALLLLVSGLSGSPLLAVQANEETRRPAPSPSLRGAGHSADAPETTPAIVPPPEEGSSTDVCEDPGDKQIRTVVHGNAGNDRLYGGGDAVRLFGDEDRDFVAGGRANDQLNGGEDADTLMGGSGADRFIYDSRAASPTDERGAWSSSTGDTIVDFFPLDRDRIDLAQLPRAGRDAPATYRWSGARAEPYSVWARPWAGDTLVLVDVDGDGQGDVAIRLLGGIPLSASSFCGVEQPEP